MLTTLAKMEHFIIENDHIKNYTFLITNWNRHPHDRVFKPIVVPFNHNQRVSALVEQLRQQLFIDKPKLCMTGEIYLRNIYEHSLDNEALLKDVILEPEKRFLHTNCYKINDSHKFIESSDEVSTFSNSNHINVTLTLTHRFFRIQILRVLSQMKRRQCPPPKPVPT